MNAETKESHKLLIACVDRDNDLGVKTGLESPIIGQEQCTAAGTRLSLIDPEEADANAIFAAVKEFRELSQKGHQCEVVVLSGVFERGVEADRKILNELKRVLNTFNADGMILVSDGVDDEQVIPVIQGLIPIVSVKRVIIRHSRSMEESYAVFGRYLRMLAYDPRYSKYFLGLPGVMLLIIGLLIYMELSRIAFIVVIGGIGVIFLVRGFELDRVAGRLRKMRPSGYIRFFSVLASLLIIIAALTGGFSSIGVTKEYVAITQDLGQFFTYGPFLIGLFIFESLNLLWIGLGVLFAGTMLSDALRRSARMLRDAVGLLVLVLLYLPLLQLSLILEGRGSPVTLVSVVLFGLAVMFLAVAFVYEYIRVRRKRS
jgi:putative membrane protein